MVSSTGLGNAVEWSRAVHITKDQLDQKLYKNYLPKKKEEEEYKYSSLSAFRQILQEMNSIANQHEIVGESLINNVMKEVQALMQELRAERKKHLQDFKQEDSNLEKSIKKLESTKTTYKHSHEAWVQAKLQFERANDDMNQTKAQVEKYRQTMNAKNQQKCECKDNYILQLDHTNKDQRDFYYTKIPQIFNKIQEMDERRIQRLGEFYKVFAEGHRHVIPLINNCLDTMTAEAEKIDSAADSKRTIDKFKSGLIPPDDFPMQDLDEPSPSEPEPDTVSQTSVGSANGVAPGFKKEKKRGGIFNIRKKGLGREEESGGSRSSAGIKMKIPHTPSFRRKGRFRRKEEPKEDFSHLPPNQQSKKLKEKIEELHQLIESEVKSKEGLQRMREVYTKNPTLGDPASVDRQLAEIGKKMDGLRMELAKYQKYTGHSPYKNNSLPSNYLAHAEGKAPTPQGTPQNTPHSTPHSTPQPPFKTQEAREAESERLPPSGAETPLTMTEHDGQNAGEPLSPGWGGQNSFDEQEEPICKCSVLYDFQSEDDNLLSVAGGEEMDVVEMDSGDGWTRVRRDDKEGYVPTSYIQII
ncbi:formin-binding protein 1-like [Diadema antillarum]|uniref:formin-binding protein 1-like n=1 Tax=Diadema antillarum TaxID=105358 RepID=UPI003A852E39